MSGSTCRSNGGQSGWPWTRRRRTHQLDTRVADGGFYHFHPPAEVQKVRQQENTVRQCSKETTWVRLIPHCAHLVVLEHGQLDLLPLVLVLLWSGVRLLLPLFSTTTKSEHQVQRRLLRCRRQVYIHEYIWRCWNRLIDSEKLKVWWKINGNLQFRTPLWSYPDMQLNSQSEHQNTRTYPTDFMLATTAHTSCRLYQHAYMYSFRYITHLLNVVIRERASIFQLFPSKDQPLLVRRDTCRTHLQL